MAESDWSRKAVAAFRETQNIKREKTAEFLATEELLKNMAPKLWGEFRVKVKEKVLAFNAEIGSPVLTFDPVQSSEILVRLTGDNQAVLNVSYESNIQHIAIKVRSLEMAVQLVPDKETRTAIFFDTKAVRSLDPDKLADKILNTLLNIEGTDYLLGLVDR